MVCPHARPRPITVKSLIITALIIIAGTLMMATAIVRHIDPFAVQYEPND